MCKNFIFLQNKAKKHQYIIDSLWILADKTARYGLKN